MVMDTPPSSTNGIDNIRDGDPQMDIVIGVTPFANASWWNDVDSCAYVPVSFIRNWIESVIFSEVILSFIQYVAALVISMSNNLMLGIAMKSCHPFICRKKTSLLDTEEQLVVTIKQV